MNYMHPKIIDTEKKIAFTVTHSYDYFDPQTKVTMNRKLSLLFISTEDLLPIHLHEVVSEINTTPPDKGQAMKYFALQSLIKICTDNAEDVNHRLLNINLQIPLTNKEISSSVNILRLSFMKLKDRFIEFIKKDELIKQEEKYSSNQKMKLFRTNLNTFILDRDIYTHGQLHLLRPSSEFVIEYIDFSQNQKKYVTIEETILKGYNDVYKEIIDLILTFNRTRKKVSN